MKNLSKIIFSSATTFILFIILGIALGLATFIEDKYDTLTAKLLIYNAKWLEILFLLLVFNLIGHIIRFKLFNRRIIPNIKIKIPKIILVIFLVILTFLKITTLS